MRSAGLWDSARRKPCGRKWVQQERIAGSFGRLLARALEMNPLSAIYGGVVERATRFTSADCCASRRAARTGGQRGEHFGGRLGEDSVCNSAGRIVEGARRSLSMCFRADMGERVAGVLAGGSCGTAAGFWRRASADCAASCRVPVVVGEDRYEAGQFAEAKFGAAAASAG